MRYVDKTTGKKREISKGGFDSKKEAAIYMYGNEEKRIIEKNINGIVYYTYWGGNEVCTMWKDVKDRMMEQCFYVGEKIN
ncbi:Arm DNA-binding domain-containing protein [Bacillus thuringiensis]|nr:Arm DNA-binding domain-containing protein [Bacillus thuringiensis]